MAWELGGNGSGHLGEQNRPPGARWVRSLLGNVRGHPPSRTLQNGSKGRQAEMIRLLVMGRATTTMMMMMMMMMNEVRTWPA